MPTTKCVERAVCLRGKDLSAALVAVKTVRLLSPDDGQMWLMSVWFDWRGATDGDDIYDVRDGIGLFFDLYFAKRGDFAGIERQLLDMVPQRVRDEAVAQANELAALNAMKVAESHDEGAFCHVDMTTGTVSDDAVLMRPPADAMPS